MFAYGFNNWYEASYQVQVLCWQLGTQITSSIYIQYHHMTEYLLTFIT